MILVGSGEEEDEEVEGDPEDEEGKGDKKVPRIT